MRAKVFEVRLALGFEILLQLINAVWAQPR